MEILINLVKNSVEAMPGGGKVFIETVYEKHADENLEGDIVITVQDDGPGIPDYIMSVFSSQAIVPKGLKILDWVCPSVKILSAGIKERLHAKAVSARAQLLRSHCRCQTIKLNRTLEEQMKPRPAI